MYYVIQLDSYLSFSNILYSVHVFVLIPTSCLFASGCKLQHYLLFSRRCIDFVGGASVGGNRVRQDCGISICLFYFCVFLFLLNPADTPGPPRSRAALTQTMCENTVRHVGAHTGAVRSVWTQEAVMLVEVSAWRWQSASWCCTGFTWFRGLVRACVQGRSYNREVWALFGVGHPEPPPPPPLRLIYSALMHKKKYVCF